MPSSNSMVRARALGYAAVALGLAAVVLGLAWRQVAPEELFWTEADAREYAEAFDAAHEASIGPAHSHGEGDAAEPPGGDAADVAGAKARFREVRERLESARAARNYTGPVLAAVGAVLAGAGVVVLRRAAQKAPRRSDGGQ